MVGPSHSSFYTCSSTLVMVQDRNEITTCRMGLIHDTLDVLSN